VIPEVGVGVRRRKDEVVPLAVGLPHESLDAYFIDWRSGMTQHTTGGEKPVAGTHVITGEEKEELARFIRENPLLSDQLPSVLPSGFRVDNFHPICEACQGDIPASSSWLKRVRLEFGQKTVETWDVRGVCRGCRTATSCYMRYRCDGTYDTLIGGEWRHGDLRARDSRRLGGTPARLVRRFLVWILGGR